MNADKQSASVFIRASLWLEMVFEILPRALRRAENGEIPAGLHDPFDLSEVWRGPLTRYSGILEFVT
jgi:hypothetical protein